MRRAADAPDQEFDDADDIRFLANFCAAPLVAAQVVAARPEGHQVEPCDAHDHSDDAGVAAADLQELADLRAIVAVPAQAQRYQQRSWQHAAHARDVRSTQKWQRVAEDLQERLSDTESRLAALCQQFPVVQRVLQMPRTDVAKVGAEQLAGMNLVLALHPSAATGNSLTNVTVARAVARACDVFNSIQQVAAEDMLAPATRGSELFRVSVVATQWDETTQSMRDPRKPSEPGTRWRTNAGQTRSQTMLVFSHLWSFAWHARESSPRVRDTPWFSRALFLFRQTANDLIEGLLRSMPYHILDRVMLGRMSSAADVVILCYTRDGASANTNCVEWLLDVIVNNSAANILPHNQMCLLHRTAIARTRLKGPRDVAVALQSLTRWLRLSRNLEALVEALHAQVARKLVIRHEARPQKFCERQQMILDVLFNGAADGYLYRGDKPSGFLQDLTLFLDTIDLYTQDELAGLGLAEDDGPGGGTLLTHWCSVAPGSREHGEGRALGTPCCSGREETLDKVMAALINFIVGRSWGTMALNRWTTVGLTMRRFVVCSLGPRLLPAALDDVRRHWGVQDTLEAGLARAVAIDREDFASQNKLRLLRLAKVLCKPTCPLATSLSMVSMLPIDEIMYDLFGHQRTRATLWQLMDPAASSITMGQLKLLACLSTWTAEASWFVASVLGVGFADRRTRMMARAQILQASCGILDCFELQMEKPPFSLIVVALDSVPRQERLAIANSFFAEDPRCLSVFAQRLRRLYPNPSELLARGCQVIEAWAKGTYPCIDLSERGHALMRVDLKSSGRGRSPTVSSNRCMIKQIRSAHRAMGGHDVSAFRSTAQTKPPLLDGHGKKSRKGVGSNPKMVFVNKKLKTGKRCVAPNRSLTKAEQEALTTSAKREWAAMDGPQYESWATLHYAEQIGRRRGAAPLADQDNEPFEGLWGLSCCRDEVVPSSVLLEHGMHKPMSKLCRARVWQDETLNVRQGVLDRYSAIQGGWSRQVDGCHGSRKNVCREHVLPVQVVERLNKLTRVMSAFADSRKVSLEDSSCLVCLIGKQGGSAGDVCATHFFLLADARFSPKMQYYAHCHMLDANASPSDPPFDIAISSRAPRLPGNAGKQAIDIRTSDEVAHMCVAAAEYWEMVEVRYSIDCEAASLVRMRVEGFHDVFEKVSAPRWKFAASAADLPPELDVDDPLMVGQELAAGQAGHADGPPFGLAGGGAAHDVLADDLGAEDDADDLFLNLADGGGAVPDHDDDEASQGDLSDHDFEERPGDLAAESAPAGEVEAMVGAMEEVVGVAGAAASSSSDSAALATIDELVRSATFTAQGYVSTDIEPFCRQKPCGRVTTWPASKPLHQRSVSMRCYMHPSCSFAKPRSKVTDSDLLSWLFSMPPPELGSSSAQRKAAGQEHMLLLRAKRNDFSRVGESSTGAASSSSAAGATG